MNTKYIGILLMAGKSTRMNGIVKQYYASKDDEPMYIHSLKTLASFMDDVILVVPHGDEEKVKSQSFIFTKKFYPVISGGKIVLRVLEMLLILLKTCTLMSISKY